MKNITKIDDVNFRGYWVRIQRDHRRVSKRFRRKEFTSWEETKEAAIRYRDQWLQDWESTARNPDKKIQYQNSVTGELGVHKTSDHDVISLGISYVDEEGRQRNKKFQVGKKDDSNFEKKYAKVMEKAKAFRDKVNMRRFGVRWINYKRRKKQL